MRTLAISYNDMRRTYIILFALAACAAYGVYTLARAPLPLFTPPGNSSMSAAAATVTSPFNYVFKVPGVLNEAGSMGESTSPYWWVNSGGELILTGGVGETMQGDAPALNRWRIAYAFSNPIDTDGGAHPQNLFRLITRSSWNDLEETAQFYIAKDNVSASPNRNQSNGLLLMSRYTGDGQTLYYMGIRVDGTAVIKKKYHGTYYTLAQKTIFPGTYAIAPSAGTSQNLLPHGTWIGLRGDTVTNQDGSVSLTLSMQTAGGQWVQLLSTTDAGGASVGYTRPITGASYAGIRTDFMDVRIDSYQAKTIAGS